MTKTMKKFSLLTVGVAGLGLIACGPSEKEGEPEPVDHVTARQALNANTKAFAADISTTAKFLERSELLRGSVEVAASPFAGEASRPCAVTPDGATECEGETTPDVDPSFELDVDLTDEADEMLAELEARILNDASVEADEELAVTYLVRGDLLCAEDGQPLNQDCVTQVDQAEIRIVVTSPAPGDVDVDLLVGPNRVNPLSFQVHQDMLAAEADLGAIKDAALHIGGIIGEGVELPATFEGRLRAELTAPSDHQLAAAFSVLQAVKVADGDFSFSVGQSLPFYSLALDSNLETLTGTSNIGAVDGMFPISSYEYDSVNQMDIETNYDLGFHLSGATGTTVLDVANEIVRMTGIGLGPDTSTVSIDGEKVVSIDLNADDGRTLDATISEEGDGVKLAVDPAFDLSVAFEFAKVADVFSDIDDWMLDEVFSITLDGAAEPAVLVTEDRLEVLDGSLTMSMQNAAITHTISAGQCMLGSQDAPVASDGGQDSGEPGDSQPMPPTEEPDDPYTPLDDVEVGACQ